MRKRGLLPVGAWLLIGTAGAVFAFLWWSGIGPCRSVVRGDISLLGLFPVSVSTLLFAGVGGAVLYADRRNAIGWLLLVISVTFPAALVLALSSDCLAAGVALPGGELMLWFAYVFGVLTIVPIFGLLPMLFPDGRFLSHAWQGFTWTFVATILVAQLTLAFVPGEMQYNLSGFTSAIDNPFGMDRLPQTLGPVMMYVSWLALMALAVAGVIAFVVRFRHSTGDERQQLKWFAYFMVVVVGGYIVLIEGIGAVFYPKLLTSWLYELILVIVFWGFPIVIGIAIFKYRLYDIDILINRTLVYGSLTALLALIYFGSIVVLQRLFTTRTGQSSDLAIVISTLVIAVLFNPLRLRLQGWIDRRFYRRRYDAEQALQAFARTTRNEANLERITAAVAQVVEETVQPAGVSIWLQVRDSGQKEKV